MANGTPNGVQCVKFWRTAEELTEPDEAEIVGGKIPSPFHGIFLRVGPAKFDFENFKMVHWFDGYSMITKFQISENKVLMEKKFLNSSAYTKAQKAQKPLICEYATRAEPDPSSNIFSRMIPNLVPELTDNCNINAFTLGKEEVFITGETCFFHQYDLPTMKSVNKYDTNKCFGLNIASAHPLKDPETKITYNIGNSVFTGLKYHIVSIPPPVTEKESVSDLLKKSKTICTLSSRWTTQLSYMHSFGMTSGKKGYFVLIEQPFLLDVKKVLSSAITKDQCFRNWVFWRPEYSNKFIIVEKETGKVVLEKLEFLSEKPFFFLHMINTFVNNFGEIVVDIVAFDDPKVLLTTDLVRLRAGEKDVPGTRSICLRFVIPINEISDENSTNLVQYKTGATAVRKGKQIILTPEILFPERGLEMPVVNPKNFGNEYKYFYASGLTSAGYFRNSFCKVKVNVKDDLTIKIFKQRTKDIEMCCKQFYLKIKVDIHSKEAIIWRENESNIFGEPIFIPESENGEALEGEDEGIILIPCTSEKETDRDFLLFIEAKSLKKEYARALFKKTIPPSIHSLFLRKK